MRLTIHISFENIKDDEADEDETRTDETPTKNKPSIEVVQAELFLVGSTSPDAIAVASKVHFEKIRNRCSEAWQRKDITLGPGFLKEAGELLGDLLDRDILAETSDTPAMVTDQTKNDSIRAEALQSDRQPRTPLDILRGELQTNDDLYIKISCGNPALEELPWELLVVGNEHIALRENVRIVRLGRKTGKSDDRDSTELRILNINMSLTPLAESAEALMSDVVVENPPMDLIHPDLNLVHRNIMWPEISEALRQPDSYSVVHFAGHGKLVKRDRGEHFESEARPVLCVGSDERVENVRDRPNITFHKPTHIKPGRMAILMSNNSSQLKMTPSLAVLACCDAGIGMGWSGFGVRLMEEQLPAIVSMQAPVQDRSTNAFVSELYERLRNQDNIATAVARARRSISTLDDEQAKLEWWVPILHTKNPSLSFLPSRSSSDAVDPEEESAREDPFQAGEQLRERGQVEEALETWEGLFARQVNDRGPNDPDTLKTLRYIATALRDLGRKEEALQAERTLLARQEQVFGENSIKTIKARRRISTLITVEVGEEEGKFKTSREEALAIEDKILKIQQRHATSVDQTDSILTRRRKAEFLSDLGHYREALEVTEEYLAAQQRLLEESDHPDIIQTQTEKAKLLKKRGRYREALKVEKRIRDALEDKWPKDDHRIFEIRNNIAETYHLQNKHSESLKEEEELLEDRKRYFGDEHPDTIKSRANISVSQWHLGRCVESLRTELSVLRERERVLGDWHRDTLKTRNNRAITLANFGKFDEALRLHRSVSRALTDDIGLDKNHPEVLHMKHYEAMTLRDMGQLEEALSTQQRVERERSRRLGPEHPGILETKHEKAITLRKLGRMRAALRLQNDVIKQIESRADGHDELELLLARHEKAISLRKLGRCTEALELHNSVLEGLKKKEKKRELGIDHPDTLVAEHETAVTLAELGRFDDAIKQQKRALEKQQEILGGEHPNELASRHHLALMLTRSGRLSEVRDIPVADPVPTDDEIL